MVATPVDYMVKIHPIPCVFALHQESQQNNRGKSAEHFTGYSEFQPATLKHVQTLLGQMGKIKGRNSDPYTETGLARQISLASPQTEGAAADGSGSQKVLYAPRAAQWGRVWRAW